MDVIMQTREEWGARPPKARRYDVDPHGVSIHWPGAPGKFRSMNHAQHQALMRNWQAMHMTRGSNDIEYGSVVCPCGIWMEGRTEFDDPMVRVGSNGSRQANKEYTSVQMMLGTGELILNQEKQWLAEAVAWLRKQGWGGLLVPHSALSQTSCCGDSIRAALPEINTLADNLAGIVEPPAEEAEVVVIFIQHKGKRYACYPSAGVKRHIGSPQQEKNIRHITERVGGKVVEWSAGRDVSDPGAFGVTIS